MQKQAVKEKKRKIRVTQAILLLPHPSLSIFICIGSRQFSASLALFCFALFAVPSLYSINYYVTIAFLFNSNFFFSVISNINGDLHNKHTISY